jgi:hypothetical protein
MILMFVIMCYILLHAEPLSHNDLFTFFNFLIFNFGGGEGFEAIEWADIRVQGLDNQFVDS